MNLKQVIVELRHAEPLKIFKPYEEIYNYLTGKQLPDKPTSLPGFELNVAEKKMRIVVEPKRTAIVLGDPPNRGYCIDNTLGVIKKISELTEIPELIRLGIRGFWIQESKTPFKELVSAFKERVYKPSEIVEEAVDFGTSFTLDAGNEYKAQVNFGPMELSQLKTMFSFELSNLPEIVAFLDLDYYIAKKKAFKYSATDLRAFIEQGLDYTDKFGERLVRILAL